MFKANKYDYYARYLEEQKKAERDKYKLDKNTKFYNEVCVATLNNGMGGTHIAASIANFLSEYGRAIVKSSQLAESDYDRKRLVAKNVKVVNPTDNPPDADYVINDIGVVKVNNFEIKPLVANILICDLTAKNLTKLASYVNENPLASEIIYLFNFVTESNSAEIKRLMESYPYNYIINGELFDSLRLSDKNKFMLGQSVKRNVI